MKLGLSIRDELVEALAVRDGRVVAKSRAVFKKSRSDTIVEAVRGLIKDGIKLGDVKAVNVAVDLVKKPLVNRKGFGRVAVIRLSYPQGRYITPLIEWPDDLRKMVLKKTVVAHGGHEIDGTELSQVDRKELMRYFRNLKGKVDALAITSPFSTVYPDHEYEAFKTLSKIATSKTPVYASNQIGDLGFAYRENATVLNAASAKPAQKQIEEIDKALNNVGVKAPLFILQNSGMLMSAEYAKLYPVLTTYSQFSAEVLGLSASEGIEEGVLADLEGDEIYIGPLSGGYPVISDFVDVDGFKINSAGPLLLRFLSKISSTTLQKAIGSMNVGAQTAKVYAANRETKSFMVKKSGRRLVVKMPRYVGFLGALGTAEALLGSRVVRSFRPETSKGDAVREAKKSAKSVIECMGVVLRKVRFVKVEEAPLPTLPAGARRIVVVAQALM